MKTAIIIPARYASTRMPGKPLAKIAGQTMLQRVVRLSQVAAEGIDDTTVIVATDDKRIAEHCELLDVKWIMTPPECPSGTDRVAAAVALMPDEDKPDFILNMQGDAPLTPPDFLRTMIEAYQEAPCDAITPVTQLTWNQLDRLRESKTSTPFSGTTAVFDPHSGKALWFSKAIIPVLRNEAALRNKSEKSPIYRHIGLYGYARAMLEKFVALPASRCELLEGLEQLRVLENGFVMRCVPVDYKGRPGMSGVDSPQDITRAEKLIARRGEIVTPGLSLDNKHKDLPVVTKMIVARHGNTFGPTETVTRIGVTDLPLVSSGREQGRKLGAWLKKNDLIPDAIFTSKLKRAQQTAEEAQLTMGTTLPIEVLAMFDEIDYGPDENQPENKVARRIGNDAMVAWESKGKVPEGWIADPDQIIRNWQDFTKRLLQEYAGKRILVVTSNGIIRFAPHLTGDFEGFRAQYAIKINTGCFSLFEHTAPAKNWVCSKWNYRPVV